MGTSRCGMGISVILLDYAPRERYSGIRTPNPDFSSNGIFGFFSSSSTMSLQYLYVSRSQSPCSCPAGAWVRHWPPALVICIRWIEIYMAFSNFQVEMRRQFVTVFVDFSCLHYVRSFFPSTTEERGI